MIKVTFISAEGEAQTVEAVVGQDLLSVAQAAGQPLEGTCEGQMACSTCHVIVDKRGTSDEPLVMPDYPDR
jgi:ferredoxin